MKVSTLGLDLAKNVFQVHGVDDEGNVTVRRQLRRQQMFSFFSELPPCLIGLEACGTSHYWARELAARGHDVRIIPPSYVKPYVRRGKNDAADAEAICEAVGRPNMRFVPVKSEDQQAALMQHKARELLIRQQNMLVNALRSHMAEMGMVAAQGRERLDRIVDVIMEEEDESLPALARASLRPLVAMLQANEAAIDDIDRAIKAAHKENEVSQRLASIPGVGVLTASAIAATVPDPSFFKSGREFAAWLGLVPRQNSSGGKERLGRISKQGNRYLRKLLVIGATSMLSVVRRKSSRQADWAKRLLERKPTRLVTIAMANKAARIAWALMTKKETYRTTAIATAA
ncbi:IS110 family transposase [Thalassospira indica]|jgi:transposase|uniref:IS110 family transposase n=1 Tax=Thalassospira indica TaxID=1891279 RepID=A0ABM6Y3F2_9PROT|nr:IS110 family transposase [Thalassospira indica]AXO14554.1 IS110 family transposase [Thalassospira indica]AXO15201.1 IS110 family transposase [Thalassospira indica]OAZ07663.1 transposase [Thalassospira profundimaris]|tara:strand:- start:266 stop:1297 length:1032 start_codon:yes stop_codon:yes gene_type:complete